MLPFLLSAPSDAFQGTQTAVRKPEKLSRTKIEERAPKKPRLSNPKDEHKSPKEIVKTTGQSVGALIGRKRKERKVGKK